MSNVEQPDWRLNVYLDLYKVEFQRSDQVTAVLHAQWGYLTALATGLWLLSRDAVQRWTTAPTSTAVELAFATAGFVILAIAAIDLIRVHIGMNKIERLTSLREFEEYRDKVSNPAAGVTPEATLCHALCLRLRDARDNTARWNKEKTDKLWRARGFKATALACLVVVAALELLHHIGG